MIPALQEAEETAALRARPQSRCFVCGPDHPHGLRIAYRIASDGAVSALWTPAADWEGFEGVIHGGIVSTVLDEAMSKAVVASKCEALTSELRVRFRRRVSPDQALHIRAWVAARRKRLVETEATLTDCDGIERAHAWASFLALRSRTHSADAASGTNRRNK